MSTPEVSVVTVVRNGADTIAGCLASVAGQDVPLEHIIVDGGSTDGTLDVLRGWTRHRLDWTSGPDRGISDAFNVGILRTRTPVVGLLNADDAYEPGALRRALAALAAAPQAAFAFGHCRHREADGREWLNLADPRYALRLRFFMPDVNHPTMLVRRAVYDRIGLYDLRWRMAMDYDWLIRATHAGELGVLVDAVQARMAMGGLSDRRWRATYAEARRIAIAHGAPLLPAWLDFTARIAKGTIRRTLVACGARGLERRIRLLRQRRMLA